MRWTDVCTACHYRPCRCWEIKIQDTLYATVQAFVECATGEKQKRWRQIAHVIDLLPLRGDDMDTLIQDMERNVCSQCDRTSFEDPCRLCRDASICYHSCRRDECLFCGEDL